MKKYEDIRENLKTGDIVLFSGKGGISHGIKLVTNSKWSHVGMVLRLPDSKAAYDGPLGHNEEDLSSLFCSELVAEAYQRIGLLTSAMPSNEYTPKDFAERRGLKLEKGKLGEEISVEI